MAQAEKKLRQLWYKSPYPWILILLASLATFSIGQIYGDDTSLPQQLRLSGYKFVTPLVLCNANNSKIFPEDKGLRDGVKKVVDAHIKFGDISKGSVNFFRFSDGVWANVYGNEKYYPSSLGKIPIMMAYFLMAQKDPNVLNKKISYDGGPDLNKSQDIKPAAAIIPGKTYAVEELIEYMIKYSDNNAAQILFNGVDKDDLDNIYSELNIPVVEDIKTGDVDVVTPQQITLLFRVLYNATYLSRDYSEKALQLMSESSFTQGIFSGVPISTVVAHKLGLVGITNKGGLIAEHELHDCGIVYGNKSYALCVMTRGSSDISILEKVISDISKKVYDYVE